MPSLNKVTLIGHLGRDPEVKYLPTGTTVANFSIATTEKYNDKEHTEWHRIIAFGKLADICGQYLKKGALVYIDGRIQTRSWEDKQGNKKQTTEIVANRMLMLSGKKSGEQDDTSFSPPEDDF